MTGEPKISRTLYLCYFGLREPLVQTQVLPYLREIGKGGTKVSILTFEAEPKTKWTAAEIADEKAKLAAEGIEWNWLTYHKRPSAPATAFDVFCGAWFVWKKIRRDRLDVIHARIHVPATMGALARKFSGGRKPKLIFDIRGFFPEEYTDAGVWPENGWLYRTVKRLERWLLKESDGFVVLTEKARDILFPESAANGFDRLNRPVEVIPCCVNLRRFETADDSLRETVKTEIGATGRRVISYVGSFGGWYLTEQMADFFKAARDRDPRTFALILTQSDRESIAALLRSRGFSDADFYIAKVAPTEVPRFLAAADAAISFIKPCFSKLSSSPTKIAEYLIAGVPVISNRGVGDVAEQLERTRTGAVIESFDPQGYADALDALAELELDPELRERCRATARREFDLETVAGEHYRRLYRNLLTK